MRLPVNCALFFSGVLATYNNKVYVGSSNLRSLFGVLFRSRVPDSIAE